MEFFMELNTEIKNFLETLNSSLNIENHPFFVALNKGEISKDEFLETQLEFSHLVKYFNRPMALVVANIPDDIKRMAIVDNLWEEHGQGVPEKIHGRTIRTLIERLGGDLSEIDDSNLTTNIKIFNQALRGVAAFESYQFATAVFGGIERSFVDISTQICNGIVNNGWLPLERVTHYALHKEIDIKHAEDFLIVSNDEWDKESQQKAIKSGIEFGANLFLNVYTNFYNEIMNKRMSYESTDNVNLKSA